MRWLLTSICHTPQNLAWPLRQHDRFNERKGGADSPTWYFYRQLFTLLSSVLLVLSFWKESKGSLKEVKKTDVKSTAASELTAATASFACFLKAVEN